jgi:hypothetical protein
VSDKAVLHLVKMWLVAPAEETDRQGHVHRTTRNKDEGRGSPQGSPISPLLANLYMRRFVLGWKTLGYEQKLQARIVNYADDFVICCRGTASRAMQEMRSMMLRLKLTVNEMKTKICRVPRETFDFLGYTFGRYYSPRTGKAYLDLAPAQKKVRKLCESLGKQMGRNSHWLDPEELVKRLNRKLRGWANYFCLGSVSKAYARVDRYVDERLCHWWRAKYKKSGSRLRFSYATQPDRLGLARLRRLPRRPPVGDSMKH